ncbi:hypothetical protein [Prosthecobacter sp.]|uniref:hypothetical protein n=1 Tax=Prosthecobacter sp. TaxID=1965333 RepID=UPI003783C317
MTTQLACPHCHKTSTLEEVLEGSRLSWPAQRWLYFYCPACEQPSHVEISESRVRIGTLDGVPGPCFIPDTTMAVQDLRVTSSEQGIELRYAGRVWFVQAHQ